MEASPLTASTGLPEPRPHSGLTRFRGCRVWLAATACAVLRGRMTERRRRAAGRQREDLGAWVRRAWVQSPGSFQEVLGLSVLQGSPGAQGEPSSLAALSGEFLHGGCRSRQGTGASPSGLFSGCQTNRGREAPSCCSGTDPR